MYDPTVVPPAAFRLLLQLLGLLGTSWRSRHLALQCFMVFAYLAVSHTLAMSTTVSAFG